MNGKEFFIEVAKKRQLQKKYVVRIEQEKLIDAEIDRVYNVKGINNK